jgi:CRP/FNR family transcriptional regulator, cyclic AMP receptor protein
VTVAAVIMKADATFDWEPFLAAPCRGKTSFQCGANHTIFGQGQAGDSVFFLRRGRVRLAVTSHDGKEAIIDTINAGGFFGEECLGAQPLRVKTATSVGAASLIRVEKATMARMIRETPGLAQLVVARLLTRLMRSQEDFVDQLFNSSEKRLARTLLMLSRFSDDSTTEMVAAGITQEHLAQMVGTTRSRVNYFLNKFRTHRLIDYSAAAGITVHRGLLGVVQFEEEDGWEAPRRRPERASLHG